MQEHDATVGRTRPEQRCPDPPSEPQPDRAAHDRAEHLGHLRAADAGLEHQPERCQPGTQPRLTASEPSTGRRRAAVTRTAATNSVRATTNHAMV